MARAADQRIATPDKTHLTLRFSPARPARWLNRGVQSLLYPVQSSSEMPSVISDQRGTRDGRAQKVPSKRVAIAAARALVAADKKRGVASSEATRRLAAAPFGKSA